MASSACTPCRRPPARWAQRCSLIACLVGASFLAVPLTAQDPDPIRSFAGGEILLGFPTGEFAENVEFGIGLGGHIRFPFDPSDRVSLRLDVGFLNYGNETIRICVTQPCRVTGDLTTSNNILSGGIGPEVGIRSGRARLYANAGIGFAWFATSSSVRGSSNQEDFASSTNQQDLTFAWTGGGGVQFQLTSGRTPLSLDLGARYHGNGEATYLRRGDIIDEPDGSVSIRPRRSETNLWTVRIGVSVGIPESGFRGPRGSR